MATPFPGQLTPQQMAQLFAPPAPLLPARPAAPTPPAPLPLTPTQLLGLTAPARVPGLPFLQPTTPFTDISTILAGPPVKATQMAPTKGGQSQGAPDVSNMMQWVSQRGGRVTSDWRSPAHNRQVGGVENSFHKQGSPQHPQAFDSVPPAGMSMSAWHGELRRQFPGWQIINEGDHVHVEPQGSPGSGYAQNVMSNVNNMGGLVNPFDPTYGNMAISEIDKAKQAAMKPFEASYDLPAAPEVPKPELAPRSDFSKADAALEQLRPEEMTEKEALKIRRDGWLNGIGQALASLPDGAGLGRVLAAIGGGALMGRTAGDAEVRARQDAFDDKMARYTVAVANQENMKAQTLRQELQFEVGVMNTYAQQKYEQAYTTWQKTNQAGIVDGAFVTSTHDPKTNKVTYRRVPIASAVESQFGLHKANVYSSMMGGQNSGNALVAQQQNAMVIQGAATQAMLDMQNPTPEANPGDAIVMGIAPAATAAVLGGQTEGLIGPEKWPEFDAEVTRRMRAQGHVDPSAKESIEARQVIIATMLTELGLSDQGFRKQLMGAGLPGQLVQQSQADQKRRTQTQMTPRGQRTTVTEVGP